LYPGIGAVQLQGLGIGLACQLGIHIAEVLMRSGIAGVGPDRHLQSGTGLVELALACVQYGQVVVGLRQLRVVFGQLGEGADGVGRFAGFRLDHAFEEPHLWIARFACQKLVGLAECFWQAAGPQELAHVAVFIGMGRAQTQYRSKGHEAQRLADREAG
jgi:hypothetical protein